MSYLVQSDLEGLVPPAWLTEGLDDAGEGSVTAFESVKLTTENAINGALSGRYSVPLELTGNAGLTACISEIAVCLAVEALYIRRQIALDKDSLLVKRIGRAWSRLDALAKGTDPLSPNIDPVNAPGEVIGEASRVYSASIAA